MTEQFPQPSEQHMDRAQLVDRIRDSVIRFRALGVDTTLAIQEFLNQEIEDSGLSDQNEKFYFMEAKKAALYFDAGFPGEAITTVQRIVRDARDTQYAPFVTEITKNLQSSFDAM